MLLKAHLKHRSGGVWVDALLLVGLMFVFLRKLYFGFNRFVKGFFGIGTLALSCGFGMLTFKLTGACEGPTFLVSGSQAFGTSSSSID